MKRYDYFFRQNVSESELDAGFEAAEQADRALFADLLPAGVVSGLGITEASPANLTVTVAAGTAYDSDGQRIRVAQSQPLDVSVDSNGVSTAVGNSGNAKVVSVFLEFTRALTDPRVDGSSATVYFERAESFALVVRQGLEATSGSEAPPDLEAGKILLADIQRTFGQTQIQTANINSYATNRRQDAYALDDGLLAYRGGSIAAFLALLRQQVNDAVLTPSAISGNHDDYSPTGFTAAKGNLIVIRQDLSAAAALRGLITMKAGTRVRLLNLSDTYTWTINHEDNNSGASSRILCPNGANVSVRPTGGLDLWRDGTTDRWRVVAP